MIYPAEKSFEEVPHIQCVLLVFWDLDRASEPLVGEKGARVAMHSDVIRAPSSF